MVANLGSNRAGRHAGEDSPRAQLQPFQHSLPSWGYSGRASVRSPRARARMTATTELSDGHADLSRPLHEETRSSILTARLAAVDRSASAARASAKPPAGLCCPGCAGVGAAGLGKPRPDSAA